MSCEKAFFNILLFCASNSLGCQFQFLNIINSFLPAWRSKMKKRLVMLAVASFVFTWILSGCFQTETWTTITAKGGMERKVDIQIDKTNKDQLKPKKEAFEKDGWKVSEDEKDAKYHLIAEKKVEVWTIYQSGGDANAFKSPFDDTQVKLEKKDKKFLFTEVFDSKKSAGITDTSRSAWSGLKYTFHLTMPAKIEKSTADKTDGSKATWEFDVNKVFDTGTFTMSAECSEAGGMCGSTIFVSGIGLALLLFLVKFTFDKVMVYRRRNKLVVE